ncbi:MAG: S49 family peptidase, partial [Propionibacteriaceae bacterium]|nr:S49 family peptidase [Propionibacteriaceae bacterium]
GLGVVLLVMSTVLSLLSFLGLMVAGAAVRGAGTSGTVVNTTTVWGPSGASNTLRAVDVTGPILTDESGGGLLVTGTYGYEVAKMIDELDAEDAGALILRMNTPGGTVTGSKAIADAVARYQQRTGKKVFAHVQGMSASGGMYAMAGADEIQADYGSQVGSIGVIMGPLARFRDVVAVDGGVLQGGVTTTGGIEEFYLTQGRGKDAGNPYRDLTEEERTVLMDGLENEYTLFVDHVATLRDIPAQTIRDDLGAHLFDGQTAEEKGLIDGRLGVDEAYRHYATEAGFDPADTKVVAPTTPGMLGSLLGAERRVPGQALPVATQAGVRPVTAPAFCGPALTVLAFQGDLSRACG